MIWYLIALATLISTARHRLVKALQFNPRGEPAIKDDERVREQPKIKGEIEFRDLTFAYNGKSVLENISLKIEQGKTVAFVGKTGSGKSTL